MPRLSISRQLSYDAISHVLRTRAAPVDSLDLQIQKCSSVKRLDINLAYEITFGSLRWWGKLYWILQNYASRDLDQCSVEVRVALVAGTYQLFYLDRVPARSSVNESVEYVRQRKQASAVSFVNGVLRQVAVKTSYFPKPNPDTEPVDYLALQFAHPHWLVNRWHKRFGYKKLHDMLKSSNDHPPFTVRICRDKVAHFAKVSDLHQFFLKVEKIRLQKRPQKYCYHLPQRPLLGTQSLFDQGYFAVQDEASQLIAPLVDPQPSELIIDACSGPGGKLIHLYELCLAVKAKHPSKKPPHLMAFEKKEAAYSRMMSNIERMGVCDVMCFKQDFLTASPSTPPNKILLDAPCSGLGVLRRHPEGKMFKEEDIISHMVKIQRELLTHAWNILADGGELIYSVCSFEIEECQQHLQWMRKTFAKSSELISPKDRLQSYYHRYVTAQDVLAIYCGNSDRMDGFSAFILKKVSRVQ